jgi:protoheme IX farnesyltransferase
VALVAATATPLAFGAGWVYALGAAPAGAWFVAKSWQLARAPSRATAMASFFASLVHLTAVLAAAALDAALA